MTTKSKPADDRIQDALSRIIEWRNNEKWHAYELSASFVEKVCFSFHAEGHAKKHAKLHLNKLPDATFTERLFTTVAYGAALQLSFDLESLTDVQFKDVLIGLRCTVPDEKFKSGFLMPWLTADLDMEGSESDIVIKKFDREFTDINFHISEITLVRYTDLNVEDV
jgi:hypothetical protein